MRGGPATSARGRAHFVWTPNNLRTKAPVCQEMDASAGASAGAGRGAARVVSAGAPVPPRPPGRPHEIASARQEPPRLLAPRLRLHAPRRHHGPLPADGRAGGRRPPGGPRGVRGRLHPLRPRRHLRQRPVRGDLRAGAPGGPRHAGPGPDRHQVRHPLEGRPRRLGPAPLGLLARAHRPLVRGLAAAAGHRVHRPLHAAPARLPRRPAGDRRRVQRPEAAGQGARVRRQQLPPVATCP